MKTFLVGLLLLVVSAIVLADDQPALKVGDRAPDFTLPYATRDSIASDSLSLSKLIGHDNVVLAFYPADWSGGCTKEVCTLRDNFTNLAKLNADVVAISGDYVFSHHEWAVHHNLPFKLASDHNHHVAKEYGSYMEPYGFNRRTVFVVDHQGKIAYMDMAYSVRDSVSFGKLQAALQKLK